MCHDPSQQQVYVHAILPHTGIAVGGVLHTGSTMRDTRCLSNLPRCHFYHLAKELDLLFRLKKTLNAPKTLATFTCSGPWTMASTTRTYPLPWSIHTSIGTLEGEMGDEETRAICRSIFPSRIIGNQRNMDWRENPSGGESNSNASWSRNRPIFDGTVHVKISPWSCLCRLIVHQIYGLCELKILIVRCHFEE